MQSKGLAKNLGDACLSEAVLHAKSTFGGSVYNALAREYDDYKKKVEVPPMTRQNTPLAPNATSPTVIELLTPVSAVQQLISSNVMTRSPFKKMLAVEVSGFACGWVGETQASPVALAVYGQIATDPYNLIALTVASNELVKFTWHQVPVNIDSHLD